MNRRFRRQLTLLGGTAAVAAIDLGTKVWASHALRTKNVELPGPVDLQLSHNRGVAFGAFARLPTAVMIAVTIAVTIFVIVAGLRGMMPLVPTTLVAGGALGNVIDRIEGGSVVDLLHTGWWPTFNVADTFITIGIGLLVLHGMQRSNNAARTVIPSRDVEETKL